MKDISCLQMKPSLPPSIGICNNNRLYRPVIHAAAGHHLVYIRSHLLDDDVPASTFHSENQGISVIDYLYLVRRG